MPRDSGESIFAARHLDVSQSDPNNSLYLGSFPGK